MNFYATIARYYDSEHADKDEDFAFYSELASEADGPILIIGSGTGRVALHLAEQGHTVHGIEIENAMFQRAEAHLKARPHLRERVTFHHADAMRLKLDLRFGLVILPYNTFMHFLTLDAQRRLLARIAQWVKEGGALAVDLPNAGDAFASQDTEAIILERTFIEQDSGHLVMQQSSSRLDRTEQLMEVTWLYDEIGEGGVLTRTVVPVQLHYFFFNELWLLLEHSGLDIEEVYGDFDRSEFVDGCPRMIVVARQ
jgi:SAM-dependent methyltransferase